MKPLVIGLALEKGIVKPETLIQTAPGRLQMGSATITDAHPHGVLSVNEVIQKSSNVGTVKIALQMQPHDMWEIFTQMGLGQKPQVPFPGAVSGKVRAYKTWKPIEQATMSYGYGLSTSLFQLAQAYSVFARDGELVPLTIERSPEFKPGTKVLSPKAAIEMRAMLETVTEPGGTAIKAQAEGFRVGGKTGTAHKLVGKGYGNKYRAYFAGLAPISAPRIVVAVMIDEPTAGGHYGGDVAAPVFSTIVSETLNTLNVLPDSKAKQMVLQDKNLEEVRTANVQPQHVVLKR
jgi:cell division protein FtsI (penicillin-binding protein 3)